MCCRSVSLGLTRPVAAHIGASVGVIQRCLVSAGNLVSIGFSGFALIWSSAQ
jgi:hypothetical protein